MKKLVLTALCAVAFGACGDDGDTTGDVTIAADAAPGTTPDAAEAACNAVTQAGCEAGEKCAQVVAQDEPFLASTACVPDGAVTGGGECAGGDPGPMGYDNCVAGYHCLQGVCAEICTNAGGDSCRTAEQGFGEGYFCTLYQNLFNDEVGLCVSACDPTNDTVVEGVVKNASCPEGSGCYLNAGRGVAACAGVPEGALAVTQNTDCYGPMAGTCFLNGCASGYSPLLPNAIENSTSSACARYCSPAATYIDNDDNRDGVDGKCSGGNLTAAGSDVAATGRHECRYIERFYGIPEVPASQGFCVPVNPWYDCSGTYDRNLIVSTIEAAGTIEEKNDAYNMLCYGILDPVITGDPADRTPFLALCDAHSGFGCTSLETEQEILDMLDPPAASGAKSAAPMRTLSIPMRELMSQEMSK